MQLALRCVSVEGTRRKIFRYFNIFRLLFSCLVCNKTGSVSNFNHLFDIPISIGKVVKIIFDTFLEELVSTADLQSAGSLWPETCMNHFSVQNLLCSTIYIVNIHLVVSTEISEGKYNLIANAWVNTSLQMKFLISKVFILTFSDAGLR